MFKKTLKFVDFNDQEQTKDFYFHISKAEVMALSAEGKASMQERIKRITAAQDGLAILNEFREIIKLSVGVRSEDGSRFIKDADAQSQLLDSPALDVLLMELVTTDNGAVEFVQQLIPEKMQKEILEAAQKNGTPTVSAQDTPEPLYQKENRRPTDSELRNMSQPELMEAFRWTEKHIKE